MTFNKHLKSIVFSTIIIISPWSANASSFDLGGLANSAVNATSSAVHGSSLPSYSSIEYQKKQGVDNNFERKKKAWKTAETEMKENQGRIGRVNVKRYTYGRDTNVLEVYCRIYETGMRLNLDNLDSASVSFVEQVLRSGSFSSGGGYDTSAGDIAVKGVEQCKKHFVNHSKFLKGQKNAVSLQRKFKTYFTISQKDTIKTKYNKLMNSYVLNLSEYKFDLAAEDSAKLVTIETIAKRHYLVAKDEADKKEKYRSNVINHAKSVYDEATSLNAKAEDYGKRNEVSGLIDDIEMALMDEDIDSLSVSTPKLEALVDEMNPFVKQRLAAIQEEKDRLASIELESKRVAEEKEKQRLAAIQAEKDRLATIELENKRAAEEKEKQRLAGIQNEKLLNEAKEAGFNTIKEFDDAKKKRQGLVSAYGLYVQLKTVHSFFQGQTYQLVDASQIAKAKDSIKTIENCNKNIDTDKAWAEAVEAQKESVKEMTNYNNMGMTSVTADGQQTYKMLIGMLIREANKCSGKKVGEIKKDF